MRGFIVLCLSAVAMAAPQGYTYSQNQVSVGATGLGGVSGLGGLGGVSSLGGSSGGNFQTFAPVQATAVGSASGYFNNQQSQQQIVQQVQQPILFSQGSSSASNFIQQQHVQQQPQQTIITKKFYLHSAPEENDEEYREKLITVGTPRKNYNVVFIRAPSKASKKAAIKIIPAANEEKTVIYVLSKKTDAADIHAEVAEVQGTTAKPEVFFIKYKTNQEAAHAQQQIQAQYDSLGGTSQVSDEGIAPVSSVIGSLGTSGSSVSGNVEHSVEQSVSLGQVQQLGNVNNAYLPPNYS